MKTNYVTPTIDVVEIEIEGTLCASVISNSFENATNSNNDLFGSLDPVKK